MPAANVASARSFDDRPGVLSGQAGGAAAGLPGPGSGVVGAQCSCGRLAGAGDLLAEGGDRWIGRRLAPQRRERLDPLLHVPGAHMQGCPLSRGAGSATVRWSASRTGAGSLPTTVPGRVFGEAADGRAAAQGVWAGRYAFAG